jgi:hypothetical protein
MVKTSLRIDAWETKDKEMEGINYCKSETG